MTHPKVNTPPKVMPRLRVQVPRKVKILFKVQMPQKMSPPRLVMINLKVPTPHKLKKATTLFKSNTTNTPGPTIKHLNIADARSYNRLGSQVQDTITTPEPTIKSLDIADALRTTTPMATRNFTIAPTRQDPRATEPPTPEPTFLPTPTPTPAPTPLSTPETPWVAKFIGHDQVQPFSQPEPVTISERAGVKFKPQIHISSGCRPYPAVNWHGETGGGLKTTDNPRGGCRGFGWGSQIYGRSTWFRDVWAIMYSWYFPKDSPSPSMGHRHDWEHIIVWIDNPDVENPKI
ncbi:unnamed protein product [Phytophthora lilii]|uniref:Unnamed protein product n=1 Tax=Phytophthora lilii TaxID=2077276 RepID=A0A9W6XJK4_9STRA|nr:unnamed protein product [Phytophthora lilii]